MNRTAENRAIHISFLAWTFQFSLPGSRRLILSTVLAIAVAIAVLPFLVPASGEEAERESAESPQPEEIPLMIDDETPEERQRRYREGDISSVFRAAFHEGEESDLVYFETGEEAALFESWRRKAEEEESGLALFRLGDARDGVTRYQLALGGDQVVGIVRIRNRDGAWEVVGAERPATDPQALDAERRRMFRMAEEKNRER